MSVVELKDQDQLNELLKSSKEKGAVLFLSFWAEWHPPCKQMAAVVAELARDKPALTFVQIEADRHQEITENYPVESVPTFVVIKGGEVVEVLEGAAPPKLVSLANQYEKTVGGASANTGGGDGMALNDRLQKLVRAAPVMLFMKGDPENPRCKFSRETIALLKTQDVKYGYFDILTDDTVREGLKTYSNWKTYPQLYIKGEFIGGLDIMKEMVEEGELAALLPAEAKKEDLNKRLAELVKQERVMLFMKGSPESPQCGFSSKMVALLRECEFEFGYFNILIDNDVREGLKTFSNWKTFPQLYVDGALVGGLDVCLEMHEEGEFAELAQAK